LAFLSSFFTFLDSITAASEFILPPPTQPKDPQKITANVHKNEKSAKQKKRATNKAAQAKTKQNKNNKAQKSKGEQNQKELKPRQTNRVKKESGKQDPKTKRAEITQIHKKMLITNPSKQTHSSQRQSLKDW
jgi:hypothetical protein